MFHHLGPFMHDAVHRWFTGSHCHHQNKVLVGSTKKNTQGSNDFIVMTSNDLGNRQQL